MCIRDSSTDRGFSRGQGPQAGLLIDVFMVPRGPAVHEGKMSFSRPQVNPPRSAIFDGFNGFKRSRTFWISKDQNLCVYKASGRHTCSPGSVPAGTGISPVPTGTLPGGPRGPLEAIQTRRLCRVDDMGAWVCPDSTKWSRIALCGALAETRFFANG